MKRFFLAQIYRSLDYGMQNGYAFWAPVSHTRHSSMDGESRLHIVELVRYVRAYKRRETSHNDTDKVDRLKRIVAVIAIQSARLISYATRYFFKNFCSRYLRDMSNVPSIFFSEAYSRSSSQWGPTRFGPNHLMGLLQRNNLPLATFTSRHQRLQTLGR